MTSTVPDLPSGWRALRVRGPAGFVTHATLVRPDGSEVEWSSRRHRKGLGLRGAVVGGGPASALSWWIGGLFALGSVCFALGSVPLYFDQVAPATVAATFFVGSIFFTSAAYLQFHETLRAPTGVLAGSPRPRLLAWSSRRIDAWAVLVQLVGTVFFNLSTFAATRADLTLAQERHLVWAPDVGGSICFLVASWLAYAEVNRGILPRSDRSVGWGIAALNLLGSVAFGVAAVAARYLRSTGELANLPLVNLGTFLGAVCFLVGAVLLPVESARERSSS
ncbi:hypothetical protein [Cellulomonas sp.]|uniref:hypothetical protein n=1 Tax=Cellulomonas sp. TaxID=40001 RepID=UPI003BAB9F84